VELSSPKAVIRELVVWITRPASVNNHNIFLLTELLLTGFSLCSFSSSAPIGPNSGAHRLSGTNSGNPTGWTQVRKESPHDLPALELRSGTTAPADGSNALRVLVRVSESRSGKWCWCPPDWLVLVGPE